MYPEMEDPETQAAELAGQYDHVYYLGNGKWNDSFEHQFQQVYTNTITQSTDENYSNTGRRIIMFPLSYQEVSYTVSLYAYWGEEQNLSYPAKHLCQYGILWVLSAGRELLLVGQRERFRAV